MADILADCSQASMAHAVEANLFAFFRHLGNWPRVELHDDRSHLWTLSDLPYPLFNSVVRARLADDDADATIDARTRECSARGVPLLWWTGPSTTPADLGDRLIDRGFLLEPAHGMAADMRAVIAAPARDARNLTIERVTDQRTLATWSRVLCDSFGAPQSFGDAFADLAAAIGLGPASPFQHFLGRLKAEPVATCSLFLGAGVAGIYDVATLPERRRRGIGAAITRAAMTAAAAAGYRIAILHSSDAGATMYRALGFTNVCPIGQYVWAPEQLKRNLKFKIKN